MYQLIAAEFPGEIYSELNAHWNAAQIIEIIAVDRPIQLLQSIRDRLGYSANEMTDDRVNHTSRP